MEPADNWTAHNDKSGGQTNWEQKLKLPRKHGTRLRQIQTHKAHIGEHVHTRSPTVAGEQMAALLWWIPHISLPLLKDMFILLHLPNYRVAGEEGSWRQKGGGREGWVWGGERQWVQVFRNSWSSNEKRRAWAAGGQRDGGDEWERMRRRIRKKRQQINISWETSGICDEPFMMIDIIKRKKKRWNRHMLSLTWCDVHCTHTDTVADRLANTAGSLSGDLRHAVSHKHRTQSELAAGCEQQQLSSVCKQCLLLLVL